MKLEQIETADMDIKSIKIYGDKFYILFSAVYDICLKQYVENVELIFFNWTSFNVEMYDSSIEEYKQLDLLEINKGKDLFTLIQVVNISDDKVELEGFNDDGAWNKVVFFNTSYSLNVIDIA
ncbi:hypothetical protein [Acinetobacter gyllenbergii]|uniref:hypothetical protein n=1 Tax=Acinetobacter gyllenbergii TaxID=134534 RepID=UPI0003BEDDA3|nr:hypothetical protein [Acinetobacter gyllenbergii]ESK43107.1 hypothetical protein F987_01988 [Acinetobacter gyllenbergii NIPH 230]